MPNRHRYFNIDGNSGACLELEPGDSDYQIVMKAKGANIPNSTLRTNKKENLLLAFLGKDTISVKFCPEKVPKGVQESGILIKSTFEKKNVSIEDFSCIGDNMVVTVNNFGLIEIFEFSRKSGKTNKICEYYLNDYREKKEFLDFPICLSVKEKKGENCKFAISTVYDDEKGELREEEVQKSLQIFEFTGNKIKKIYEKKFEIEDSGPSSAYYYVDFTFEYKGREILLGFQNEGERNLDVFSVEKREISKIFTERGYHSDYFSGIRRLGDEAIVSVDYSGNLKILRLKENKEE